MKPISLWVKIPYSLFVGVFIPVYWIHYGPVNFLWFSDIALIGTLLALWLGSRFLLSMMTTGVMLFDIVWCFIFFRKLIEGGGAEGLVGYMFDSQIHLFIRALSLFHVMLPGVQLWALGRLGYDVRAWKYQVILGWALILLTYAVTGPLENINWVYGVTEVPQRWLPAHLYVAAGMVIYPTLVCFPTHRILKALFWHNPAGI